MRGLWSCEHAHYLLVILDILVSHSHEQLPEVLPLVVLPPLHVGFQISIETFHPILTFLNICWHLEGGCVSGRSVCVTGFSWLKLPCWHICEGPNYCIKNATNTLSPLEAFVWRQSLGFSGLRRNSEKGYIDPELQTLPNKTEAHGGIHPTPFTNGKKKHCNLVIYLCFFFYVLLSIHKNVHKFCKHPTIFGITLLVSCFPERN